MSVCWCHNGLQSCLHCTYLFYLNSKLRWKVVPWHCFNWIYFKIKCINHRGLNQKCVFGLLNRIGMASYQFYILETNPFYLCLKSLNYLWVIWLGKTLRYFQWGSPASVFHQLLSESKHINMTALFYLLAAVSCKELHSYSSGDDMQT